MMLGNLSLDHIQKRVGVIFPDSLISFMEPKNQANAKNIQSGYWHCFDIPFMLVCGDVDTAIEIFDHLKPLTDDFKVQMEIGVDPQNEQ